MNRMPLLLAATVLIFTANPARGQNGSSKKEKFHKQFIEDFGMPASKYFTNNLREPGAEDRGEGRYSQGIESRTEKGTKIMLFRIDPEDPAGPGRGPEIISKDFTHFGSYSVRLRIPDVTKIQPDAGAVVGYFTYHVDAIDGVSEIDIEWLIADPEIIYVGTWTGQRDNLQRIGRTINLAEGKIYYTSYYLRNEEHTPLTGIQNQPETIQAIEGYDASSQFYTYGFDWYPDRLTWWMIHPATEERIVLWDYTGSTPDFSGIPQPQTRYRLNFWHTDNWPVETRPNSVEKPLHPYEVEIDWMSYTPLDVK